MGKNFFYLLTLLGIVFYSFSQVDLNLTLSTNDFYQKFQKELLFLGYYRRLLSAVIFLFLIFLLFLFYLHFLKATRKNLMTKKKLFQLLFLTTILLLFSYPAFSHDVFNYLFDARIVTKYHLNPYFFSALDFPDDLWTRFMHWTHRKYPYGPAWLLITLPFSFLGKEKFLVTLFNFKLMFIFFYLGNLYFISKILGKISPQKKLWGLSFYAFNPLILIETLVSPHNESVMLFFLLVGLYYGLIKRNFLLGFLGILLSFLVKFLTIMVFLPLVIFSFFSKKKNPRFWLKFSFFPLFFPLLFQISQREIYPWYFVTLIGLGACINGSYFTFLLIALSLASLFRYAPYLFFGDYRLTVKIWQNFLFFFSLAVFFLFLFLKKLKTGKMI